MSSHHPDNSAFKPSHVDYPFDDFPSSLEAALNQPDNSKLNVPYAFKNDTSLLNPDDLRRLSVSTISGLTDDGRPGRPSSRSSYLRYPSRSPAPPMTWKGSFERFWQRNRGLWLVAMAQLFGALMNVTTRLLELEGDGMHPLQILFARMGITMVCCCVYMWYKKVPYFPFGQKGIRKLLVARGLTGFFGIFGMYYSLQYLPIAEATVITFLAPCVAGFACYVLMGERFTKVELVASIISLFGVILIARPTSFFHLGTPEVASDVAQNSTTSSHDFHIPNPTTVQRLSAVGVSLLGVLGAAGAYTTIRWIGKRAHPLISVNYFAVWCTLVSTTALTVSTFAPGTSPLHSDALHFKLPSSFRQWGMLFALGTCGFIMQFMLTAGMSHEKSNRATNMVYTQMLFALLFDRWIFGTVPGAWSLIGSAMILGSAIYVAVQKGSEVTSSAGGMPSRGNGALGDEEMAMLDDVDIHESTVDTNREVEAVVQDLESVVGDDENTNMR
jgi:drug/metabolite transporter (DMT)-like permease